MQLKPLRYREVERKLLSEGFEIVGTKGGHVKFGKMTVDGFRTAIVPRHREIRVGTLRSILRQAGISTERFMEI